MFRFNYFYVFLLTILIVESNSVVENFIKPCKPNDNQCIKESARKLMGHIINGVPEVGMPSIDPLFIDSVRADGVNLKFGIKNIKIYGASKCEIIELGRNIKKSTIKLTVECPSLGVGQYEMNGKILLLDIFGDGDIEIKTDKFRLTVEVNVKYVQKGGQKYWKLTGFDYSYEFLEKVYIKLDNLFGGDEVRAKVVRDVLDSNWKEFTDEIGGPFMRQVTSTYINAIKKLMEAFPANQLELA